MLIRKQRLVDGQKKEPYQFVSMNIVTTGILELEFIVLLSFFLIFFYSRFSYLVSYFLSRSKKD